jgi:outer membrane protein assembly factor BamB
MTKPLRLWPGVVAVAAVFLARFGLKAIVPGFSGFSRGMMWSFGAAGAVVLWWLLLSRARWWERLGGVAAIAGGLFGAWSLRHPSMGPLWIFAYAVPGVCLALVAGAAVARRLPAPRRLATIAATILFACGAWTLVRTEGISGDHDARFHWRWQKSSEERLLAQAAREPAAQPPASPASSPAPAVLPSAAAALPSPAMPAKVLPDRPVAEARPPAADAPTPAPASQTEGVWPGFRGPGRDGVARGVRIATDWAASPPVELWRRPVGPGWSSFAVQGNRIYTQEQRGEDEVVTSYDTATGAPVWTHRDPVRFFESNAGAGPRGTPTLANGRVYTFGATGILNALGAEDGAVLWSRDASADAEQTTSMGSGEKKKVPDWGFSSSPLVVDDVVIVAAAGQLLAYEAATGKPRWTGPAGGVSYSSPHRATIGGVTQVLLLSGAGVTSVGPADGKTLWQHAWRGFPIVQPALTAEGDVLVSMSGESGVRRLAVTHADAGWAVAPRWTSAGLKPYFNDFVVHEGHAFGFDGRILSCIDLADGTRKWKGGRYGNGQLLLLPDQGVLLVLSEEGELALVRAAPDQFTELARFRAIEGKTWNHPAIAGAVLLVRNGEEMAAFRLPATVRVGQITESAQR